VPVRILKKAPSAYEYPLLIRHLLHTALATAPSQEIVYRDQRRHSYVELNRRIGRLASVLAGMGVEQGSTVAIIDWDSHRYLESYFAVPMLGAVLQTVNVRLSPQQILYTLNHSRAEYVLIHRDFLPLLEELRPGLQQLRASVLIADGTDTDAATLHGFVGEYEALIAATPQEFAFEDFDENAIATTFYTTGTTGQPKAVCYSHRQLVLHTLAGLGALASPAEGQSFRHGDVYMPLTPMFHAHGWGVPYIATVLGVKQVYPGRYDPEFILALKRNEGATFSHCVPTILGMLLNAPSSQSTDLRGWKLLVGGAALPAGLARSALERGIDVWAGYGMSETGPLLVLTRIKSADQAADTAAEIAIRCKQGLPIPLVDLRIVDEHMRDLPHDGRTAGEVVARAPWLTMAYAGNPEASVDLWRGGYLHTQDMAALDPDGYLQLSDRMKDIIKSGGEWVSSLLLEDLISRHAQVAEVAVLGMKDERWGERPMALIVCKAEHRDTLTPTLIKEHMVQFVSSGAIKKHDVPERIEIVIALEKTSVGKLNKKLMRERLAERDEEPGVS
jgi:fatty-acyl-CoA synthase